MPLPKSSLRLLPILAGIFLFCHPVAYGNDKTATARPMKYSMLTDSTPLTCGKSVEIEKIIAEAISLGAPIYNQGMHMACYRIYEWAGYKILYEYGKDCPEVEKLLKTTIERSHGDYSDTEKAWLMRMAFDRIMGVPTKTEGLKNDDTAPRKG